MVFAELGIFGLLVVCVILFQLVRLAPVWGHPFLVALFALSLFDHFLWTLQPGRLMLWLIIGIVIGVNSACDSMDRIHPSEG